MATLARHAARHRPDEPTVGNQRPLGRMECAENRRFGSVQGDTCHGMSCRGTRLEKCGDIVCEPRTLRLRGAAVGVCWIGEGWTQPGGRKGTAMRVYLWVLCVGLLLALPAWAQDEPATGPPGGLELGVVRPVAVDLSQAGGLRIFGLWDQRFEDPAEDAGTVHRGAVVAPLSGTGDRPNLVVAIDATDPDATGPDVIRFDFTGQGDFAGAPTLELQAMSGYSSGQAYSFGPGVIEARIEGRTWPVWVRGQYYRRSREMRYIRLSLGMALEGWARFGERVLPIRIFDASMQNARVGDGPNLPWSTVRGRNEERGDVVAVDTTPQTPWTDGPLASAYVGTPIEVDGQWYDVTLNDDRTRVEVQPSSAPIGYLQADHANWNVTLVGEKYVLRLSPVGEEPIAVPADRYVLVGYAEMSRPLGERKQEYTLYFGHEHLARREHVVEVRPGETTAIQVGSPLTLRFKATRQSGLLTFEPVVTDTGGRVIESMPSGPDRQGAMPALTVRDAEGNAVHTGRVEYG